jgi:hypothetical protein
VLGLDIPPDLKVQFLMPDLTSEAPLCGRGILILECVPDERPL